MWNELKERIQKSKNYYKIYENHGEARDGLLHELHITEESALGMILKNTAGISLDNGWLRFFGGSASEGVESIREWNLVGQTDYSIVDDALVVAYDLTGGFFCINEGSLGNDRGNIYYFAPDNLEWEGLELGYNEFFDWALDADLNEFYQDNRWQGYVDLSQKAKAGEGILLYPPLWSEEGEDVENSSKEIVPLGELWDFNQDALKQLF